MREFVMILGSVLIVLAIWMSSAMDDRRESMKHKIGKRVYLDGDTLTVIGVVARTKSYTLSNGTEIPEQLLNKIILK